jgi:hypothetical protein
MGHMPGSNHTGCDWNNIDNAPLVAKPYACTAQCGSATTTQCGVAYKLSGSTACSATHATYEGCSDDVCDEVCAMGVTTPSLTAGAELVTSGTKSYNCWNVSQKMYMMEAKAIEQSVAMNCGPGAHNMSGMWMIGSTHPACASWSNDAPVPSTSTASAFGVRAAMVTIAMVAAAFA